MPGAPTPTPSASASASAKCPGIGIGCNSGRIHTECTNKMCRKHCVLTGGCGLPTHGGGQVRGNGSTNGTSGSSSSSIRLDDLISPNDWNANIFGPMHALGVQQQQAASETVAKFRHLDKLYGVRSPSPETREREQREDDEIALAIRLSLDEPLSRPASRSSSTRPSLWLPMSITEAGRLRSLSPSPDLPEPSMLLPPSSRGFASSSSTFSPHSASSSSRTFPTSSAWLFPSSASSSSSSFLPPVSLAPGRAAAPSATSKPKKPLRITRQLNDDWAGVSASSPAVSTTTYHTKKATRPKSTRLIVVLWNDVRCHAQ